MTPLIDRVSLNLSAHLVPSAALTVRHHTGETFESDLEKSVSFMESVHKKSCFTTSDGLKEESLSWSQFIISVQKNLSLQC